MSKYLTLLTLVFSFSIFAAQKQPTKETENTIQIDAKSIKDTQANEQVKQSAESEANALLFIPDYLKPKKEPVNNC